MDQIQKQIQRNRVNTKGPRLKVGKGKEIETEETGNHLKEIIEIMKMIRKKRKREMEERKRFQNRARETKWIKRQRKGGMEDQEERKVKMKVGKRTEEG